MNILISGATGMVGAACSGELFASGHEVRRLNRGTDGDGLPWDPENGRVNFQGFVPDALIHLAGENLANGRWTEARMKKIRDSRVEATRMLCDFLALSPHPPKVMLSASAIGLYGPRASKWIIETSPAASDFLGELCFEWERATQSLERIGCRIVHMRFGVILSPTGGALKKMLPIFRMGLGGPLGDGTNWMSWISLEDAVRAIIFLLDHAAASGPVNIVSPNPVTSADFGKTLGQAVKRPTFLRASAGMLRTVFGEFADATLLSSQRVEPQRLKELGFEWKHPELADAFHAVL